MVQRSRRRGVIRVSTAVAGALVLLSVAMFTLPQNRPTPLLAGVIAGGCLLAAGSAAIAARYLGQIDALELPEAPALCQGARLLAWVLGLAALSIGLAWAEQQTALRVLYLVLFGYQCGRDFTGDSRRGSPPAGFKRASR